MDIQIVSGFLGAGKTTFLNKYIPLLSGKTVVIENEYGDISIDGGLIEGETQVREITAGCICCTLAGDFRTALTDLAESVRPEHILIEPTGVGRLSDILNVCRELDRYHPGEYPVSRCVTIVDISEYDEDIEFFGAFYLDQIRNARMLFLSHTEDLTEEKIDEICADLKKRNPEAVIYRDDFRELDAEALTELLDCVPDLTPVKAPEPEHHEEHDHDHEEHDRHHEHEHDHDEHDHHHDHGHHHHHHGHDGHHHTDDIFRTAALHPAPLKDDTPDELCRALLSGRFGRVLRAKGYVRNSAGELLFIDLTSHGYEWRKADAEKAGKNADDLVVIGCDLDENGLAGFVQ